MKTIKEEQQQALEKYGHFNSTHEVYGVLLEEVEEFWDMVKLKTANNEQASYNKSRMMISELTQIAAIAERAIKELKANQINNRRIKSKQA
jgi:hypothetical protein